MKTRPTAADMSLLDISTQQRVNRLWDTLDECRKFTAPVKVSLASMILVQMQPKEMWPLSNITHPGNWPVEAVIGIETETFHRDFGNRSGGKHIKYFNSITEYEAWMLAEAQHICNIDYAYSCHVKVYEWDWGPEYKRTEYLG